MGVKGLKEHEFLQFLLWLDKTDVMLWYPIDFMVGNIHFFINWKENENSLYKCHEFGRESGLLLHSMPGSHSPLIFADFVTPFFTDMKFFLKWKSTNSINSTQQWNFLLNPHVNHFQGGRQHAICNWIDGSLYYFVPATPAANLVDVPKEPEFVIFASYSHPPNMPMRHSVLKEMVSTWRSAA